jgi:hypothetical protein
VLSTSLLFLVFVFVGLELLREGKAARQKEGQRERGEDEATKGVLVALSHGSNVMKEGR